MCCSFNSEALDYASIPVEAITLELTQIQQAAKRAELLPTARQWTVYIQALALAGFEQWVAQRDLGSLQLPSDLEFLAYSYWLNAVCRLQLGKVKICLLPLDNHTGGLVEIPRAVVELPNLTADIYLLVEVQEELELVLIGNCLNYTEIVQMLGSQLNYRRHSDEELESTAWEQDWSYFLPTSCFHLTSEDILVWLKCMPTFQSNLPQLNTSITHEQLQQQIRRSLPQIVNLQLNHLHQFLAWEQAAVLLNYPELIVWFYRLLLTGVAISEVVSPQPTAPLEQWASLQIQVNTWSDLPTQATDMMSWQPLPIQTAMRQSLTQIIDGLLVGLQQQGVTIPDCARAAYQDFSVRGATMRLYGVVWALSEARQQLEWTLLLILGSVSGSVDCDVRLTVRDYSHILAERTISSDSPDVYLYTQVAGDQQEQFWVTLQFGNGDDSDLTTVYLPPFSFD